MDVVQIVDLITSTGFPIAAYLLLFYRVMPMVEEILVELKATQAETKTLIEILREERNYGND